MSTEYFSDFFLRVKTFKSFFNYGWLVNSTDYSPIVGMNITLI